MIVFIKHSDINEMFLQCTLYFTLTEFVTVFRGNPLRKLKLSEKLLEDTVGQKLSMELSLLSTESEASGGRNEDYKI